jgi:hypothetical protein
MRAKKILVALLLIFLMSACHVFLGPDPDSSPRGIFNRIWNDFNETYALFDVKGIDWNEMYKKYSPQITPGMGSYDLFIVCSQMLNELDDYHVALASPFGVSYILNYPDLDFLDLVYSEREMFSLRVVRGGYLDSGVKYAGDGRMLYGTIKPEKTRHPVGYIYIEDFLSSGIGLDPVSDWAKEIDGIIHTMEDTDWLILDIRNNGGGLGSNMDYIAGRFASVRKDYIKSSTKNGPGRNDFSPPLTWSIQPAGVRYTKQIVLLINRETASAAEWFAMALRTQSHVTIVGQPTNGAFSSRVVRPLVNGWEYTVSVQKVTDMDGNPLDGKGMIPDHTVENSWDELNNYLDSQLEYALNMFQG